MISHGTAFDTPSGSTGGGLHQLSSLCSDLVQQRPCHVLLWDNACKRSPAIHCKSRALSPVNRLLSVNIGTDVKQAPVNPFLCSLPMADILSWVSRHYYRLYGLFSLGSIQNKCRHTLIYDDLWHLPCFQWKLPIYCIWLKIHTTWTKLQWIIDYLKIAAMNFILISIRTYLVDATIRNSWCYNNIR